MEIKARKNHKCSLCSGGIFKGEYYIREEIKPWEQECCDYDKEFWTFKAHKKCYEIYKKPEYGLDELTFTKYKDGWFIYLDDYLFFDALLGDFDYKKYPQYLFGFRSKKLINYILASSDKELGSIKKHIDLDAQEIERNFNKDNL